MFELAELPSRRSSLSRPASELAIRTPDLEPLEPSSTLLSRIGSVKKWSARTKHGMLSILHHLPLTIFLEPPIEREWDTRKINKGDGGLCLLLSPSISSFLQSNCLRQLKVEGGVLVQHLQMLFPLVSLMGKGRVYLTNNLIDRRNEFDPPLTPRASSSLSSYQQHHPLPPLPPPSHPESPQSTPQRTSNWFFRSAEAVSTSSSRVARSRSRNGNDGDAHASSRNAIGNFRTPNTSRTDISERGEETVKMNGKKRKEDGTTPTKLIKRKSFGFVHLGRGFSGHGGGEVVQRSGNEAGLGLEGVGEDDNRLMNQREKEKENEPSKEKEGTRSFMG